MHLLAKTLVFFALMQTVLSEKYVFTSGTVTFKKLRGSPVRNKSLTYVTTIDQHLFANAVDIKVRTKYMQLFEGAIKNLSHLKIIRLKLCGIEILAPKSFRNLNSLREIHLQDNALTVVENGVFNFLPIRELWLHKNKISTIRSGAFDHMPNLELIKLNNNSLTEWDSRWFANTPRLTHLLFRKNSITDLPPRAFVNIRGSHKVDGHELVDTRILLSNNMISDIDPQAFEGLNSLDELCLRRNKLEEVDRGVFGHMTELHKLNLSKNFFTKIDNDAFKDMSEMLELDLSNNDLKCVPYDIVSAVKKVYVSGNQEMDCGCLFGLREKLREERIENEIVGSECAYD